MSIQGRVYSVSQVNGYIKDLLDRDGLLSGLFVRGEISNYKMYPSGHHYFSMKDEGAPSGASCSAGRRPGFGFGRKTG